jgi:hypothetical protein
MRKVEEKGGQVEGGLTKNRVEQNTIRVPLSPNVHSKSAPEGKDYWLKCA